MGDVVITLVGVVGCGLMGSGIAEVAAASGADVMVIEATPAAVDAGQARIEKSVQRAVTAGKQPEDYAAKVLGNVRFATDIDALADREIVIEAVIENESAKLEVFEKLDAVLENREAILATNTSSLSVTRLARVTTRPEYVVGLHFFNPVPVLPLVEVVESRLTDAETLTRTESFATNQLGKTAIRAQDRAGFVVNALLVPYVLSAIRMYESGFASAADIDQGMVLGCAHPIGPLALADLIGLDTAVAVAESLYAEFKEPLYAPPPLLLRMVEAGQLGRKSGQGFFEYSRGGA
ncbi:MAG: 3-hydroxybutyryl-CoA dehydrogenase [Acidimicrobiia bacterium]